MRQSQRPGLRSGGDGVHARGIRHRRGRGKHVLGQGQYNRTRATGQREPVRMRDVLRNAIRAIDLRCPFGDAAVHAPIIDLLKRLPIDHVPADLANEHDHWRGILRRRVNSDCSVRSPRPARDKGETWRSSQFAVGFGHIGSAALLPAYDEAQLVVDVVQGVENRQKTLARHAERETRVLREKTCDEQLATGAGFHFRAPALSVLTPGLRV